MDSLPLHILHNPVSCGPYDLLGYAHDAAHASCAICSSKWRIICNYYISYLLKISIILRLKKRCIFANYISVKSFPMRRMDAIGTLFISFAILRTRGLTSCLFIDAGTQKASGSKSDKWAISM